MGKLFEEVQTKEVFEDGKTFVDCTALADPAQIKKEFEKLRSKAGFDLSSFIRERFMPPESIEGNYRPDASATLEQHLHLLWNELTRVPVVSKNSLISLPFSYIVPGGRFREIYYWDSYFTMLGLQVSGKIEMLENMVKNFSFLINTIGYIPNGNRTYYLGRSQPPFFACMVQLLSEEKGESVIAEYLPELQKEYAFWMKGSNVLTRKKTAIDRTVLLKDGEILNRYFDENDTPRPESFKEDSALAEISKDKPAMYRHLRAGAESGWDFSSRWFKDEANFTSIHTTQIIPVDLNCLLYFLERTIASGFAGSGEHAKASQFQAAALARKDALNKYCWNTEEGFYFDYDFSAGEQKKAATLAALFPLYFNVAETEQAVGVAKKVEQDFLQFGGLTTTLVNTGQQWDAPNGWAPLQWIAIRGLSNYGFDALAKDIAHRWLALNEKVYHHTGKMMEKYNVMNPALEAGGGEYPAQDGFGWTNGVYLALKKWLG